MAPNFDEAVTNAGTLLVTGVSRRGPWTRTGWRKSRMPAARGSGSCWKACAATTKTVYGWRYGTTGIYWAGVPLYLSINDVEQMFPAPELERLWQWLGWRWSAGRMRRNEPATINKNLVFLHGYKRQPSRQARRGFNLKNIQNAFTGLAPRPDFYGVTWNGGGVARGFNFRNLMQFADEYRQLPFFDCAAP